MCVEDKNIDGRSLQELRKIGLICSRIGGLEPERHEALFCSYLERFMSSMSSIDEFMPTPSHDVLFGILVIFVVFWAKLKILK